MFFLVLCSFHLTYAQMKWNGIVNVNANERPKICNTNQSFKFPLQFSNEIFQILWNWKLLLSIYCFLFSHFKGGNIYHSKSHMLTTWWFLFCFAHMLCAAHKIEESPPFVCYSTINECIENIKIYSILWSVKKIVV